MIAARALPIGVSLGMVVLPPWVVCDLKPSADGVEAISPKSVELG